MHVCFMCFILLEIWSVTVFVFLGQYTPILEWPSLELPNFLELPKCDGPSLKTDLKLSPGVLPGAPGISEILELTKSLKDRSWRKIHQIRSFEDGGVVDSCVFRFTPVFVKHRLGHSAKLLFLACWSPDNCFLLRVCFVLCRKPRPSRRHWHKSRVWDPNLSLSSVSIECISVYGLLHTRCIVLYEQVRFIHKEGTWSVRLYTVLDGICWTCPLEHSNTLHSLHTWTCILVKCLFKCTYQTKIVIWLFC